MVASIGRYTADEVKRGEVEGLVPAVSISQYIVPRNFNGMNS